ncbi:MAG: hypothetical protein AMXMBFR56_72740 [Polyangiaceae bacterium]
MARIALSAASVLVVLSGCSFIKTSAPPADYRPPDRLRCERSKMYPGIDTGIGVVLGVGTAVAVVNPSTPSDVKVPTAIGGGLAAAAAIVSAIWGFNNTTKCEAAWGAKEAEEQRLGMPPGGFPFVVPVALQNNYAESIFTLEVKVTLDGEVVRTLQPLAGHRLGSGDVAQVNLELQPDEEIEVELIATSLGQTTHFTQKMRPSKGGALSVQYDWDLALARFRAQFRWTQ